MAGDENTSIYLRWFCSSFLYIRSDCSREKF